MKISDLVKKNKKENNLILSQTNNYLNMYILLKLMVHKGSTRLFKEIKKRG